MVPECQRSRFPTKEIKKMQRYIDLTKPSRFQEHYTLRVSQVIPLAQMADSGRAAEAVLLAFSCGRAKGLRMGRREARG